jgi:hypothetical protein
MFESDAAKYRQAPLLACDQQQISTTPESVRETTPEALFRVELRHGTARVCKWLADESATCLERISIGFTGLPPATGRVIDFFKTFCRRI